MQAILVSDKNFARLKEMAVWLINLHPSKGDEIGKTRPAIVISSDAVGVLQLKIIVPLTDWKNRYSIAPWMVKISPTPQNGLQKDSAADTFQIRSLSSQRFFKKLAELPRKT